MACESDIASNQEQVHLYVLDNLGVPGCGGEGLCSMCMCVLMGLCMWDDGEEERIMRERGRREGRGGAAKHT